MKPQPVQTALYYQFLTHPPEDCLKFLLQIFNTILLSEKIPSSWKEAIMVSIPKPNRDLSDPTNYRPIALTRCPCKTMERMINDRLVWVLESKKQMLEFQWGFRKDHSTLDNLDHFEHFIREAFAKKKKFWQYFFFTLRKLIWYHMETRNFNRSVWSRIPRQTTNFHSEISSWTPLLSEKRDKFLQVLSSGKWSSAGQHSLTYAI